MTVKTRAQLVTAYGDVAFDFGEVGDALVRDLADSAGILGSPSSWTATQSADPTALTISGGTITWNALDRNVRTLSMTANVTSLNVPTDTASVPVGTQIVIVGAQDATGSRTLAYAAGYTPLGGTAIEDIPAAASTEFVITLIKLVSGNWGVSVLGVNV